MVKMISIFKLKPGFDPDDCYKLWKEEHTDYVKGKLKPELKKYVIGRVVNTPGGQIEDFGMAQLSFDDLDSALRALNRWWSSPEDELKRRATDFRRWIIEEEEVEV